MTHRIGELRSAMLIGGATSRPTVASRNHGGSPSALTQTEPRGVATSTILVPRSRVPFQTGNHSTCRGLADASFVANLSIILFSSVTTTGVRF